MGKVMCLAHWGRGRGLWWGGQKLGLLLRWCSLELSGSIHLHVGETRPLEVLLERGLSLLSSDVCLLAW